MTFVTVHEDSVNEMWSEYLNTVNDYDRRLTENWREDANGVLWFVSPHQLVSVFIAMTIPESGLFSATVASFIFMSYDLLFPATDVQTVALLGQLSQQIAGLANGTYVQSEWYTSTPPSTTAICINVLWVLSLLLSTTSALFATLMQHWARIYIDLPQSRSVLSERARFRSVLFFGMEKYLMHVIVETAPTLLHLSVFLFYHGLVIFFYATQKTVAIFTLVFVTLFGSAYFILTVLPCLDHSCPYRTPMSSVWWYLWHTSLSSATLCLCWLLRLLLNCLVPYNPGDVMTSGQRILTKWFTAIDELAERRGELLKHSFRETVVKSVLGASQDTDVKALTWLFQLPAFTEKNRFQRLVASIPGETIVQLFGKFTFREHLSTLFRSCAPGTVELDEHMRRHRLLICLNAVHHIAKPSNALPSLSLLTDMRLRFANIALMRPLWADSDPAIRVTARSVCALFARQLLRSPQLNDWELSWLQDVMGKPSNTIYNARSNLATVDDMNTDSFVIGVFSHQTDDLLDVQATSFNETLMVLMNTDGQSSLHLDDFEERVSSLIQRIEQGDHEDRNNIVAKLRKMSSTTGGPQPQPSSP